MIKYPRQLIKEAYTREFTIKPKELKIRVFLFDKAKQGNMRAVKYLKRFYNLKGMILNGTTIF